MRTSKENNADNNISQTRRDLIKTGLLGLGASAVALGGCDKNDVSSELNIIPKQTGLYEFSCPLPFNYKTIDEIVEMNSTLKKSMVTTFYNNSPNQDFNSWVSIDRSKINKDIKTYDDFGKYVKYAKDKGFKFVYLMNSPKPFTEKDFKTFEKEFYCLLDYLYKIGCRDIKVSNTQVIDLINSFKNDFTLHTSTAFEFHNISQYEYLFRNYPNFSTIDITNDENQNFQLLKALRDKFPNIQIELMINEPCIKGCPARISHVPIGFFEKFDCEKIKKDIGFLTFFFKTGVIYPWNLEYYSALKINNFKFIASNKNNGRGHFYDISNLKNYLEFVENPNYNITVPEFFTNLYGSFGNNAMYGLKVRNDIKLSEVKQFFPNISHFIIQGHNCSLQCGFKCNYCINCAKKLTEKILYM